MRLLSTVLDEGDRIAVPASALPGGARRRSSTVGRTPEIGRFVGTRILVFYNDHVRLLCVDGMHRMVLPYVPAGEADVDNGATGFPRGGGRATAS